MAAFLTGLLEIIFINVILSGDNAVVIAMACRHLHQSQQKKAIFWGSFGAIVLRVILTFVAVWLLSLPFVKIFGGLLLIYIASSLLVEEEELELKKSSTAFGAIRTIIMADAVMSLDNVVAVAAAANGDLLLIMVGLALSVPLIVWGSQLLMKIMERFPIIVTFGAALLGYTAGEMMLSDKWLGQWIQSESLEKGLSILLAVIVVGLGTGINRWKKGKKHKLQENH